MKKKLIYAIMLTSAFFVGCNDEFLEGEAFDEMIESLTLQAQEESLSNLK